MVVVTGVVDGASSTAVRPAPSVQRWEGRGRGTPGEAASPVPTWSDPWLDPVSVLRMVYGRK